MGRNPAPGKVIEGAVSSLRPWTALDIATGGNNGSHLVSAPVGGTLADLGVLHWCKGEGPRCPTMRRLSTETALENRLGPMLEFWVASPRRAPHVPGHLHPHPCGGPAGPVFRERPFIPKRPGVPILTLPHLPTTSGAHLFGARFCCGPGQRSRNAGTRRWHDGSGRVATALWCTREGQEREGGVPPPTTATRRVLGARVERRSPAGTGEDRSASPRPPRGGSFVHGCPVLSACRVGVLGLDGVGRGPGGGGGGQVGHFPLDAVR